MKIKQLKKYIGLATLLSISATHASIIDVSISGVSVYFDSNSDSDFDSTYGTENRRVRAEIYGDNYDGVVDGDISGNFTLINIVDFDGRIYSSYKQTFNVTNNTGTRQDYAFNFSLLDAYLFAECDAVLLACEDIDVRTSFVTQISLNRDVIWDAQAHLSFNPHSGVNTSSTGGLETTYNPTYRSLVTSPFSSTIELGSLGIGETFELIYSVSSLTIAYTLDSYAGTVYNDIGARGINNVVQQLQSSTSVNSPVINSLFLCSTICLIWKRKRK
ncbi:hypothetical protein [Agaribacter marinus]|uniref:PEP-CTERM sorting domain-containing protein n=1 Tax=Agaribacter marinus TaxID=1431249 RepID=A0AA37T6C5_9ALTE|nr:hypothetical protein [Agaribacter marinus]GLR72190.1 hypothetical protein GCM10007852_30980 [Agaribacter marinus]